MALSFAARESGVGLLCLGGEAGGVMGRRGEKGVGGMARKEDL